MMRSVLAIIPISLWLLVPVLAQDVAEDADRLGLVAVVRLRSVAARAGMSHHHVKVTVQVDVRGHDAVAAVVLEELAGVQLRKGPRRSALLVKEEAPVSRVIRRADVHVWPAVVVKVEDRRGHVPVVPAGHHVLPQEACLVIAGAGKDRVRVPIAKEQLRRV